MVDLSAPVDTAIGLGVGYAALAALSIIMLYALSKFEKIFEGDA